MAARHRNHQSPSRGKNDLCYAVPDVRAALIATFALSVTALSACYPKTQLQDVPLYLGPPDLPYDVGPFLVQLEPGKMAVVIEHRLSKPPVVSWRRTTASTATKASARPNVSAVKAIDRDGIWVAVLSDLPIGPRLQYRVESSLGTHGPFQFRAGRARDEKFRFAAFGDTRSGHKVHRSLIESMAKEDIDFLIHSGDIVYSGGVLEQWHRFFRIESPVIRRVPIFAAIGNHDTSPRGHFRRYFLMSLVNENTRYYTQDWGPVRVLIMDSSTEGRKGSDQYQYLEQKMRDAAERNMIMLLALHHPPYSAGAHGSDLEMREIVGELGPKYGLEVVLAGHDHNYERTKRIDGVTYMVAASGGAPIRRMTPSWFSERVRTEPHYVIFDVDRNSLVGRAVNLAGETFDSFVVPPNPARGPW